MATHSRETADRQFTGDLGAFAARRRNTRANPAGVLSYTSSLKLRGAAETGINPANGLAAPPDWNSASSAAAFFSSYVKMYQC